MNEKAFFSLSYGLFVLTARLGDTDNGCIINTAIQTTVTPNTITLAVNKSNYTTEIIQKTNKFNISVLSEDADFSIFERFGFQSGRNSEKFDGFGMTKRGENGILYITKVTNAYFECTVKQTIDLGTHYLFVADVDNCDVLSSANSMTYSYYFANVKPKPVQNQKQDQGKIWVCRICGYTYDENATGVKFEDLPDDWVCPLCKHPKSDFELA